MKTKQARQLSHSQSGKKAQVMSVDSILSYFLFALFLLLMSNYIINISKPFTSYINYEILYKDAESLTSEFVKTDVSRDYLNQICNRNYSNIISTRANYEAKAVKLPGYDEPVNDSITGVHLRREGSKLAIIYNTNSVVDVNYAIITSSEVIVNNENTESDDSYNMTREGSTVIINSRFNNSDNDADAQEIITNGEAVIFFNYYGLNDIYIGKTPFYYSCGADRGLAKKSYFSSYAVLENLNVIVNYGVEVWWE